MIFKGGRDMFYGYYGFTIIKQRENGAETDLIVRVFKSAKERSTELSRMRRLNEEFKPINFSKEICEKYQLRTPEDCIRKFKIDVMQSRMPVRCDEAQEFFTDIEMERFRKRITCGIEKKTQIYSTNPNGNFRKFPIWKEQIEKIQSDRMANRREKDIYFYGKFEEKNEKEMTTIRPIILESPVFFHPITCAVAESMIHLNHESTFIDEFEKMRIKQLQDISDYLRIPDINYLMNQGDKKK